jgi:hypothetical protein
MFSGFKKPRYAIAAKMIKNVNFDKKIAPAET